ncbi:MAG: hypothetical protein C75L2_00560006 [Leptospirillum sp. Group II 'C75']|uniref:hypothetical protein n=1 Tax=Leptospirillum sp. Group II 'CF-1' TaxID=1660083 RepID=UPI00029CC4FB|nr:hypothetical protein [Leptospirillum sp. Group II 'CF-1']AKS23504.1 hypothetical protein ABH19_06685 [Leptospirillum sp. Group II 'CF-1']EIJ76932.1 MAG: hypothetical protein C75L2_00560006 [Leptospirillum sp. Group II 'C75']
MKKLLLILAFLPLVFLKPASAEAMNVQCQGVLSGQIPQVAGVSQMPIGGVLGSGSIVATPMIAAVLPWLMQLENCVSQTVYSGEMLIYQSINANFMNLEQANIQNTSLLVNALTNVMQAREFGGATASSPSLAVGGSGCQSVDAAAQVMTGDQGQQTVEGGYTASMAQYRRITQARSQNVAYVNTEHPQSFSPQSLFPGVSASAISSSTSGSSSSGGATASETAHYILNLTDPYPPVRPANVNPNTPAGRIWLSKIKIYDAREGLAQAAMSHVATWNTGTYPLQGWLQNSMSSIGAPTPTPNSAGLISEHQMLDALVNGRFANQNWYSNISTESTTDLLRELNYQLSINNRLMLRAEDDKKYELSILSALYSRFVPKP